MAVRHSRRPRADQDRHSRYGWLGGEQLHPTQHPQVTHALAAGDRAPRWNEAGTKELKAQFFPDQLVSRLGCTLTTHATAAVLHPRMSPCLATPEAGNAAELDFFTAVTEDRYPDLFRLADDTRPDPAPVRERLAALPCRSVVRLRHAAPFPLLLGGIGIVSTLCKALSTAATGRLEPKADPAH
ncbi:hypothetical protein AB0A77_37290 [Streptomyces varsoviensis]|uniref:hypothetical protein n=1 Tax=Streptomyces varsoviensis TaxID=67373 RepID=UPI0033DE9C74